MIKIENFEVVGMEHAIRGMRNPMNSWEKSDSKYCWETDCDDCPLYNAPNCMSAIVGTDFTIGENDLSLMKKLAVGGPVHAKYRRMIVVYLDITAPLYWWKEFDTYKVGTVANSCSTMHKIQERILTLEDFSCEHLSQHYLELLDNLIMEINKAILYFRDSEDKDDWWQIIQTLPSSYNQKRTIMLNYEVLTGMYASRKNHKLDEWRDFCKWIESLPYSEIITGAKEEVNDDHTNC